MKRKSNPNQELLVFLIEISYWSPLKWLPESSGTSFDVNGTGWHRCDVNPTNCSRFKLWPDHSLRWATITDKVWSISAWLITFLQNSSLNKNCGTFRHLLPFSSDLYFGYVYYKMLIRWRNLVDLANQPEFESALSCFIDLVQNFVLDVHFPQLEHYEKETVPLNQMFWKKLAPCLFNSVCVRFWSCWLFKN